MHDQDHVILKASYTGCNIKGILIHTKGHATEHHTQQLLLRDQPRNRDKRISCSLHLVKSHIQKC